MLSLVSDHLDTVQRLGPACPKVTSSCFLDTGLAPRLADRTGRSVAGWCFGQGFGCKSGLGCVGRMTTCRPSIPPVMRTTRPGKGSARWTTKQWGSFGSPIAKNGFLSLCWSVLWHWRARRAHCLLVMFQHPGFFLLASPASGGGSESKAPTTEISLAHGTTTTAPALEWLGVCSSEPDQGAFDGARRNKKQGCR